MPRSQLFPLFALFSIIFLFSSCGKEQKAPEERFEEFRKAVEQKEWEKALGFFSSKGLEQLSDRAFFFAVTYAQASGEPSDKALSALQEQGVEEEKISHRQGAPIDLEEKPFIADITELMREEGRKSLLVGLLRENWEKSRKKRKEGVQPNFVFLPELPRSSSNGKRRDGGSVFRRSIRP